MRREFFTTQQKTARNVTIKFSLENWSGTETEEFVRMFAEQLDNAGDLSKFEYTMTETITRRGSLVNNER